MTNSSLTIRRSPITTHVLDISLGQPGQDIPVYLEELTKGGDWLQVARGTTNADGRIDDLLPSGLIPEAGTYRLTFATREYFQALAKTTFYPYISVVFEIAVAGGHHHVPLLLSPYGYSTYRGT